MSDPARKLTLRTGYWLLAVSLPFGLTLEALHGFKVRALLESDMRRELFRLAHAHGTLLGILCLVFAALAVYCLRSVWVGGLERGNGGRLLLVALVGGVAAIVAAGAIAGAIILFQLSTSG